MVQCLDLWKIETEGLKDSLFPPEHDQGPLRGDTLSQIIRDILEVREDILSLLLLEDGQGPLQGDILSHHRGGIL